MTNKLYFKIAFNIVLLTIIGMLLTFIPEHLRDFFGDTLKPESDTWRHGIDGDWDWGVRHYWYLVGVYLLFILTLVKNIWSIVDYVENNKKKSQ